MRSHPRPGSLPRYRVWGDVIPDQARPTGKTICIHHLFAGIRQIPGAGGTLIPVHVNCQQSRTASAVFSTIYYELAGHAPPGSGIPLRRLMDSVAKVLQSVGHPGSNPQDPSSSSASMISTTGSRGDPPL